MGSRPSVTAPIIQLEIVVEPNGQLRVNGPDLFASRNLYDYAIAELRRMMAAEYARRAKVTGSGLVIVPPGVPTV